MNARDEAFTVFMAIPLYSACFTSGTEALCPIRQQAATGRLPGITSNKSHGHAASRAIVSAMQIPSKAFADDVLAATAINHHPSNVNSALPIVLYVCQQHWLFLSQP